MSREIKFRAWIECRKEMLTPYFFVNDENFITQYGTGKPNSVMQFTGLKDKKGTDIYEGDIVKSLGESDYRFGVRAVEFIDGKFTVEGYGLISSLVEVIGNIYENPELIEADNATN